MARLAGAAPERRYALLRSAAGWRVSSALVLLLLPVGGVAACPRLRGAEQLDRLCSFSPASRRACRRSAASTRTSAQSPGRSSERGSRAAGARFRRSSAAIRRRSTKRASRAPRSKAWPRISPTASSRRCSGSRVGGLPGGALYKAINTADSMIGHKSERYRAFGWAAARLDDLVNLPASRLAALLAAGRRGDPARRLGARRDRRAKARCAAPPLAQRRLAGSGDGGRARPEARGAARLRRRAGRGRLHGRRPLRSSRRRHPTRPCGSIASPASRRPRRSARSRSSRELEKAIEIDVRVQDAPRARRAFARPRARSRGPSARRARASQAARCASSANRPCT